MNGKSATALAAMALASTALVFALAAPALAAAPTRVAIFAPWTTRGLQRGLRIYAKVSGTCATRSLVTSRTDAWRCIAGNDTYDPCFAGSPQKSVAACPQTPFSNTVVLFRDSKSLDAKQKSTTFSIRTLGEPWALRLDGGDTCVFTTGATEVIAGKRMNYACAKSGWVVGLVDRSTQPWTAESVSSPSDKRLKKIGVSAALF
jgi:hypothetical protein